MVASTPSSLIVGIPTKNIPAECPEDNSHKIVLVSRNITIWKKLDTMHVMIFDQDGLIDAFIWEARQLRENFDLRGRKSLLELPVPAGIQPSKGKQKVYLTSREAVELLLCGTLKAADCAKIQESDFQTILRGVMIAGQQCDVVIRPNYTLDHKAATKLVSHTVRNASYVEETGEPDFNANLVGLLVGYDSASVLQLSNNLGA